MWRWLSFFILSSSLWANSWTLVKGVNFHASCLQERSHYPNIFFAGVEAGLTCLKNLATTKSIDHSIRISKLLERGDLKVGCHERNYPWERASANSSQGKDHDLPELGLTHPFISFRPNSSFSDEYLSAVSFHETFHNVGYGHGDSVDYAYACEECCFSGDGTIRAAACKICRTQYPDATSEAYLKDLLHYESKSFYGRALQVPKLLRRSLLRKDTPFLREALLLSDGVDQPLTLLTARRWQRFPKIQPLTTLALPTSAEAHRRTLARLTEGRALLYDAKDFQAAADMFLMTDLSDLQAYAELDREPGGRVVRTFAHDLDLLLYQLRELDHSMQIPITALSGKVERLRKIYGR